MLVSDAKLNFEKSIALKIKDNPKAFFSYVRSKQKVKDAIVSLRAPQADKIVTDSQDLADLLNDYFVSVFTREDTSSIPDFQWGSDRPKLDTVLFSDDVVLEELLRLNVSKASGPDAIHPYLLKTFAHHFCVPLSLIFSKFMDEGYVPRNWRCANITPIFKKGDKTKPCNYRPVSLTSVVCKVMESIVKKSLVCHFSSQSLIRESQHGFCQ
ncbi:putative RNA-directed DNA polymerase from mobile element jockey-like [Apostichopus japonicus]|uniref:Putative RNA-directed DNA polymerase from mobile element jockey-like n=1 Tax=Stichopus japonicus TaxID=307972 RepID=A0A2G8JL83_STIJA|nr:putative RNA-directed DNA polymerase from mobile element jockey-like [Apostichopus japonicus]